MGAPGDLGMAGPIGPAGEKGPSGESGPAVSSIWAILIRVRYIISSFILYELCINIDPLTCTLHLFRVLLVLLDSVVLWDSREWLVCLVPEEIAVPLVVLVLW